MTTNPEYNAVFAAIAKVQTALIGKFVTTDTVTTNKYSYKYVPLPELLGIVTPLLNENKLIAVNTVNVVDGNNVLTVQLIHTETNDYLSSDWFLGAPSVLQTDGGKLTYYSRRLLMGLLGIHPEDDETEQVNMPKPSFMPPMGMPTAGQPPAFMPPPVNAAPAAAPAVQLPPGWTPPGVPAAAPAAPAAPVQLPPGWVPPGVPPATDLKPFGQPPVNPAAAAAPVPGAIPQFKFAKPAQ